MFLERKCLISFYYKDLYSLMKHILNLIYFYFFSMTFLFLNEIKRNEDSIFDGSTLQNNHYIVNLSMKFIICHDYKKVLFTTLFSVDAKGLF